MEKAATEGKPSGHRSPGAKDAILNAYSQSGSLISAVSLKDGTYMIGCGEDCDIQCDKSFNVSHRHAELKVKDGSASIRDLGGVRGTMVNSKLVQESSLYTGDSIQMGLMKLVLEIPDSPRRGKEDIRSSIVISLSHEDSPSADLDSALSSLAESCARIKSEVAKVIVGQTSTVEGVLVALLCQGHCLLVGVPGLAKTVMACTFAKTLGLATQRVQFTPDLMPSDIIGSEILKKGADGMPELKFSQGPIFTQVLLADEVNRTPPKTQAALLEAMQERQVTVAMKSYQLPLPFCVIATQNPIEQEGTYPLPEAQQDRFMLCLRMDYPDYKEEVGIMARTTAKEQAEPSKVVDQNDIIRFQRTVQCVGVPAEQMEYAVRMVRATRPGSDEGRAAKVSELVDWGAGPRAGQALIRGAKALAALDGRPAVSREDIASLAMPVLSHRISCNYKARAEGLDEAEVVRRILERVKAV